MMVLWCRIVSFFFNDTATTEIYTYGQTLSLRGARPICREPDRASSGDVAPIPRANAPAGSTPDRDAADSVSSRRTVTSTRAGIGRSEEHTSELKSLMRIPYAVFCLKQNKTHISNESIHADATHTSKHRTIAIISI